MPHLLNFLLAVTLWVQVPQWNDDWSNCAVDVPDTSCHWYIVMLIILLVRDLIGRLHHGIVSKDCRTLQIYMMMSLPLVNNTP